MEGSSSSALPSNLLAAPTAMLSSPPLVPQKSLLTLPAHALSKRAREDTAETLILDGCSHYPWTAAPFADFIAPELTRAYREGMPWYGSDEMVERWLPWLLEGCDGADGD